MASHQCSIFSAYLILLICPVKNGGITITSIDKDNELRHAEVIVTEPAGNVVAFYKGKSFKVC